MELATEDFSLRALCEEVVNTSRFAFSGAPVRLACEPEGAIYVKGSPRHLKQVLKNLVSNAAKFTGRGGDDFIELSVELLDQQPALGSSTYRLAVSDTGPGIPLGAQGKIFEEYEQVGVQRGTGLGLPLVKGFVALMGGEIRLTSPWNQDGSTPGAQFHFTVSFLDGAEPPPSDDEGEPLAPLPTTWNVLVADDSEINRETVKILLEEIGPEWNVTETTSGEKAVKLATTRQGTARAFDLVVTDQYFGSTSKITGTQATKAMRKAGVDAIVCGLTGDTREDYAQWALAEGQDHVLTKPLCDPGIFRRVLQRLVRAREGALPQPQSHSFQILSPSSGLAAVFRDPVFLARPPAARKASQASQRGGVHSVTLGEAPPENRKDVAGDRWRSTNSRDL